MQDNRRWECTEWEPEDRQNRAHWQMSDACGARSLIVQSIWRPILRGHLRGVPMKVHTLPSRDGVAESHRRGCDDRGWT